MRIGILGATGAVGRQMLTCIQEQGIRAEEIRLFASPRSQGLKVPYGAGELTVQAYDPARLKGLDFVLGAVSNALSKECWPAIKASGAVFIDNSSAFRMDAEVPLVVPEINGEDAKKHHGLIANPNCSTIITCMAVYPIARLSPIRRMVACTYQAVSGAGQKGIAQLENEIDARQADRPAPELTVFPAPIAFNCIPAIGSFADDGYTTEERKMGNEGRRIMHLPDLKVTCTCVRVPVYRCHSIAVSLQCERPVSVGQAAAAIAGFKGDVMMEGSYPTPLQASDQDLVYVGRLRADEVFDGGLALWCCGDQIRKGAAANAVQIMASLL